MLADSQVSWWDVAIAVVVLVASLVAARIASRATRRFANRLEGLTEPVRRGSARAVGWTIALVGLGIAATALGSDIQPLQTAAILLAVIAFITLRGIGGQFVAGIVLRTTHPYRVGDHIETGEHVGVVRQVTAIATVIETYDGRLVHVPNVDVASHPIINRTTPGGLRVTIEVRAHWDHAPGELYEIIRSATAAAPQVLPEPPVATWLTTAGPGHLAVVVKAYHSPELDSDLVSGDIADHVFGELARAGIRATVFTPRPPEPVTLVTSEATAAPAEGHHHDPV